MTYDPGPLPIRHITSCRDLLVATLAPDLALYIVNEIDPQRTQHAAEQIVAFVLDHITARSYALLAEQHPRPETAEERPS